mmetsp:Transcript_9602/g.15732  ORF Transcript_9602/g.15732 Transcript_9602/m.15732 type:complete len:269 (+) Transcript_9602:112-918(+)
MSGLVSASCISHFRRHGWVAVNGFWSSEAVCKMRGEIDRLTALGKLSNVATEGDGITKSTSKKNLQLCPLSPESTLFRAMPFQENVKSALQALVCSSNEENVCQYLSQVFLKPPSEGMGTSWHQDNEYFNVLEPTQGVAMWTAVHDSTVENGTLEVLDQVDHVLEHVRDGGSDHHLTCKGSVDESLSVPIELDAGGVAFFNYNVPHCTRANKTDKPRAGVAFHFLNMKAYQDRRFPLPDGADWRTPVIVGPSCTDGIAEYGENVAVQF